MFILRKLSPKGVNAADKVIFLATGVRCMKISVPNGKNTTAVILKHVLYGLNLGYALVSLGKCNTASFTILLKDRSCCIKDSKSHQIGRIPQYYGLHCFDKGTSVHTYNYIYGNSSAYAQQTALENGPHLTCSHQVFSGTENFIRS